jgi:hypothetical protein
VSHPQYRTSQQEYASAGFWDWVGPHMPTTPFGIDVEGVLKHGGISDKGRSGGRGARDKEKEEFPWSTFAWVSLGVVGAGILVYAATRRTSS